jgi:hypothetical protein
MLCPHTNIYEFHNGPGHVSNLVFCLLKPWSSFLEKFMRGKIKIMADQFLNFLYDEHNANQPSEEEWDVKYGLLCSKGVSKKKIKDTGLDFFLSQ